MRKRDKNLEEQKSQQYHLAQEGESSAAQREAASLFAATQLRPAAQCATVEQVPLAHATQLW